ncbi:hypothetical protein VTK56DRAFT_4245 [Thermocarpiscus australiensis]
MTKHLNVSYPLLANLSTEEPIEQGHESDTHQPPLTRNVSRLHSPSPPSGLQGRRWGSGRPKDHSGDISQPAATCLISAPNRFRAATGADARGFPIRADADTRGSEPRLDLYQHGESHARSPNFQHNVVDAVVQGNGSETTPEPTPCHHPTCHLGQWPAVLAPPLIPQPGQRPNVSSIMRYTMENEKYIAPSAITQRSDANHA